MRYLIFSLKQRLLFLFLITYVFISNGQPALKRGDTLSEIRFQTMINYGEESLDLDKDLADKLVILDYWNKGCYPCMLDFPRLDSLQRKFNNEIQIIPWTLDTKEDVMLVFNRINSKQKMLLPSAAEAKINFSAPNFTEKIWIYNGRVIAVTSKKEVNAKNIKSFISGEELGFLREKEFPDINNFSLRRNIKNVLYQEENKEFKLIIAESIPYIKTNYGESTHDDAFLIGKRYVNFELSALYGVAFGAWLSRAVIELDSSTLKKYKPDDREFAELNKYYAEVVVKISSRDEEEEANKNAFKILQAGLEAAFGITAKKEKRFVKGYVLKEVPENGKFKSTTEEEPVIDKATHYLIIRNTPTDRAIKQISKYLFLNKYNEGKFFANDVDYAGNISLDITARTNNYHDMKAALYEYGLDLSMETREKEVWVIKNI